MEFCPSSTFENKSKKNHIVFQGFNNWKYQNPNRSLRIGSYRLKDKSEKYKLYSLNDINDKITNSKGPKLSKQYRRLSDKELNQYFGNDTLIGWNHSKLLMNKYLKRVQTPKITFKSKNILNNNNSTKENNKTDKNENTDTNSNPNQKSNLKRPLTEKKVQNIIPATKRNDIWMPKNFKNYDLIVKNPILINTKINQDSILRRIPSYSYKEIRTKMNDTDIFFTKGEKSQGINRRIKSSYIFSESDIFNRKKDIVNLSKCGETYLFKSTEKRKYTTSNESNSRWQPSSNYPNLVNHPSTNFNILSPNSRNCQYNKTKQTIYEECKNINKSNDALQKKNLFFNPTHKQKGVGEFIDITKNGSGNVGKEFINKYKENPLCFQRNSEVCATFGDVYYNYKNVSTKPFMKERFES